MRSLYSFAVVIFLGLGAAVLFPACQKGDVGPTGAAGASSIPAPFCASPSTGGVISTSQPATYAFGSAFETQAVTFAASETAIDISIYMAGPVTQQVRFAVYNDDGSNYPNTLVAQTNPVNIAAGWTTASLPNVFLPSGVYHIVYLTSYNGVSGSTNNVPYSTLGQTNYYSSPGVAWGLFPDTFPGSYSSDTASMPFYLSVCP